MYDLISKNCLKGYLWKYEKCRFSLAEQAVKWLRSKSCADIFA